MIDVGKALAGHAAYVSGWPYGKYQNNLTDLVHIVRATAGEKMTTPPKFNPGDRIIYRGHYTGIITTEHHDHDTGVDTYTVLLEGKFTVRRVDAGSLAPAEPKLF